MSGLTLIKQKPIVYLLLEQDFSSYLVRNDREVKIFKIAPYSNDEGAKKFISLSCDRKPDRI
ncbi:MAG: hypothetical protein JWQ85_2251 [Mucilaginibacter sp.]|nr:hypothetical protein [Mucilaginibacter sp.]